MGDEPGRPSPGLAGLGLTAGDERVYRHILAAGAASARSTARALLLPDHDAAQSLRRLAELALLVPEAAGERRQRTPDDPGPTRASATVSYVAAAPGARLAALLQEQAADLIHAGATVDELSALFHAGAEGSTADHLVQVADGADAVRRALAELVCTASAELLVLDGDPQLGGSVIGAAWTELVRARDRGVQVRTVAATVPTAPAARSVETRVLPALALRFVVCDRAVAMLPLAEDRHGPTAALLARSRGLTQDLARTFDQLWRQATPSEGPPTPGEGATSELTPDDIALLRMLADDLTETAIGRQVGASARTVGRRLARLQSRLGTRTRFGLGAEAARRGLV
jgi:DNA-binding CsgD family transcriptional regulator/sugar-specific transcriptional regulator TrmB